MKILVCGARGFVGRHVSAALRRAGHSVVEGVSTSAAAAGRPDAVHVDFVHDIRPEAWLPRLAGIGAVVNAVGLLRDSHSRPMAAVQAAAPIALFEACARAGMRRVVQVSALGIDAADTPYARTKREAEAALLAHVAAGRLQGIALRPSVIFGRGGDSSALFMNLARLPLLILPGPVLRARVQPVAVAELAEVAATLIGPRADLTGHLECTGPVPVAMGDFIASLRRQGGHRAAPVLRLPDALTALSARLGDRVPPSPWCSETLAMLATDNVAPPEAFAAVLGRGATRFDALVANAWRNAPD
ncbi:MAG: epimerase [Variovorax sp.]|nr:epimerase [Variovorax sp.]